MKKRAVLLVLIMFFSIYVYAASVSGYVVEKETGEPVIGAAVFVMGTNLGQFTNKKGYFVLNNVPEGDVKIVIQKYGFKPKTFPYTMNEDSEEFLSAEIEKAVIKGQEIKVVDKAVKRKINSRIVKVGTVTQDTEMLKEVVGVAEADVFRSLQSLPGVTPVSDFSSGLYVRGGSPDQNLILLDNIDVYNPSHFGGLFSTFNTDAVKNVELMKGGFPAKYGGRLSSVLDITNREGNRKKMKTIARVSILSASATIESPWKINNEKGSVMGSFRRTYLDLADKMLDLGLPDFYFYDGHFKVNYDVSQKDRLSTSAYFGKDVLEMDTGSNLDISWGNETGTMQWTHIFGSRLFSQFILAGSHFKSSLKYYNEESSFDRINDIKDFTTKAIFTWTPVAEHVIDFGAETKYNKIIFKTESNAQLDSLTFPKIDINSITSAAYIQDSWDFTPLWTFQPGIRFTYITGKTNYKKDDTETSYFKVSPRAALRYKLTENSNVFASYGKYYQYLSLISGDEASPLDLWFPIDNTVPPGESDHYIAGYKAEFWEKLGFDFEVFYKTYDNLVEFRPEVDFEWNNDTGTLSDALNLGKGYSWGADVLLRTDYNSLKGFIGYTFSKTKRKINYTNIDPETSEEKYYYPKYDRTNQINVVQNLNVSELRGRYYLGAEFIAGVSYSYMTGQPTQKPEHIILSDEYPANPKFLYSYKDAERLPAYSRFDFSLKFKWKKSWGNIEPYFEVVNMFNHHNVWFRRYLPDAKLGENEGEVTFSVKEEDAMMFPRIPFIGVNIEW